MNHYKLTRRAYVLNVILISSIFAFSVMGHSFGFTHVPVASAQSEEEIGGLVSSLLRIEDDTPSRITIQEGETVTLTGHVRSLVLQNMTTSLNLESNSTEGGEWVQVSKTPSNSFALPAGESVPYEFSVRFLDHGTYMLQIHAKISEIPNRPTPIDASSPDCIGCRITATEVTVLAPTSSMPLATVVAGIVIASAVVLAVWYMKRRQGKESSER